MGNRPQTGNYCKISHHLLLFQLRSKVVENLPVAELMITKL